RTRPKDAPASLSGDSSTQLARGADRYARSSDAGPEGARKRDRSRSGRNPLSSRSALGSSPTASPRNALEDASPPMKRQPPQKSIAAIALIWFAGSIAFALRDANRTPQRIDIVVALDGSGQFKSVQDAIMSVPSGSRTKPVVIHIKPGVYRELIYI